MLYHGTRFQALDDNGDPVEGALLYWYVTGTTTDADVYTDGDLTTVHPQPMEADSGGFFDEAYLDPGVIYKTTLRTSDGTLIRTSDPASDVLTVPGYQVQSVSGNQSILTSQRDYLVSVTSTSTLTLPTAATAGEGFRVLIRNASTSGVVTIDGAGAETVNALTSISIGVNSTALCICNGTGWEAAITGHEAGSFTGTLTGYASPPTPSVKWRKVGDRVTLYLESAATGTSNATSMTLTGMPSNLYPATTSVVTSIVTDNGTQAMGLASVGTGGTVTFSATAAGGAFTGSGTKGLAAGWQISYTIA